MEGGGEDGREKRRMELGYNGTGQCYNISSAQGNNPCIYCYLETLLNASVIDKALPDITRWYLMASHNPKSSMCVLCLYAS